MQMFRPIVPKAADRVGWGVLALLVTRAPDGGDVAARLGELGVQVRVHDTLADLLAHGIAKGVWVDMVVIDCDQAGGVATGWWVLDVVRSVSTSVPVMLIASDCAEQCFPTTCASPFLLRAPVSTIALRIALETAFPIRWPDPIGRPDQPESVGARGTRP